MNDDLFIFAGEASGDLHGEKLLENLYTLDPTLKVRGVGGPRMRALGMKCILNMEDFEVMGFIDILPSLPKLFKQFKKVKNNLLSCPPKGIITIDYPSFNLRLAHALQKKNSPSKRIHYICPTVWAWGKRRIPKMERSLDHLLTILPFEPDLFSKHRLDVSYVGHPLISRIQNHSYDPSWRAKYGIENKQQMLSVFPGSREKEILRNFPMQLNVARALQKNHPHLMISVSCSNETFLPLLKKKGQDFLIVSAEYTYELMRASHLAIATSGTVTLELALHQIPTVVTFAINPIDIFIAQKLLRINLPYYSLPNILYKGELFPELFGPNLTFDSLYCKGNNFMMSEYHRSECVEKCKQLKSYLGQTDASKEAARVIIEILGS